MLADIISSRRHHWRIWLTSSNPQHEPPQIGLGGGGYLKFMSDPFLQSLEQLRMQCARGANLVAHHVDLTNAILSLRLAPHLRGAFRVGIGGKISSINYLPFGRQYSPIIRQRVLGYILASLGFSDVLVLHYLDDFPVLGYGASRVKWATDRLCDVLRNAGAILSAKSILEPVQQIV